MAKCTNCGKSGLFLKLQNGICNDCTSLAIRRTQLEQIEAHNRLLQARLSDLSTQLSNQEALYNAILAQATNDGIAQARASIQA